MIKMVAEVWRRPGLTQEEFYRYWLDEHGPLVQRHQAAAGFVRYVQSHRIASPALDTMARERGWEGAPDGIVEVWYESEEGMRAARASAEGIAASREIAADERKFVDTDRVRAFMSVEHAIVEGR